jgi:kynurenine formamidase
MAKIYDLSIPIENDSPNELIAPKIEHKSHDSTVSLVEWCMGAAPADGTGWGDDTIYLGTAHTGTHIDAPWHYAPVSEGKKARTIDQMPLDWFYHDGVVLDMRHKPRASEVTVDDLKTALKKINYRIKPWDIVLIQTGADKFLGNPTEYGPAGCGMTEESTLWLIEQGSKVMGTDALGWDRPFGDIKIDYEKTNDRNIIWQAHKARIKKEYCHIEKLRNLDKLPTPFGFKVACFPLGIVGGSASPIRAVAIFE